MPRKTYVQDPKTLKLVEKNEFYATSAENFYVMPDITPYVSQHNGEFIKTRSQHKSHLRDHGLVEIGNDIDAHLKQVNGKRNFEDAKKTEQRKRMIADIINSRGYF